MKRIVLCAKCFEELATQNGLCEECYNEELNDSALDFALWNKYVLGNDSEYRGYIHQNKENNERSAHDF